jgi:hypothetical protein
MTGGCVVFVSPSVGEAVGSAASSVSLASAVWAAAVNTVSGSGVGEASGVPLLQPARTATRTISTIPDCFNLMNRIFILSSYVLFSRLSLKSLFDLIDLHKNHT